KDVYCAINPDNLLVRVREGGAAQLGVLACQPIAETWIDGALTCRGAGLAADADIKAEDFQRCSVFSIQCSVFRRGILEIPKPKSQKSSKRKIPKRNWSRVQAAFRLLSHRG